MASSDTADVLILGGGFAGLACAAKLADGGARVRLLEKKPHLGGRAYSFKDPRSGEIIDNGQHLFMGCYRETRAFLRRIGSESLLHIPSEIRIAYAEAGGKRDALDCPAWLPAPLHLAWGILRLSGLSWSDKAGLARFDRWMRANALGGALAKDLDATTVRAWLDSLGQSRRIQERLFDPIALGALNELPETASALGFVQVLREIFYRGHENSRLALSSVGLSELYTEQARGYVAVRGGTIELNCGVRSIGKRADGLFELETDRGETFLAGKVVSTLPPWSLAKVRRPDPLHRGWETIPATPILGIHLWLDREVTQESVTGLLGTEIHWIFNKNAVWGRKGPGQYLSLVISGAHRWVGASPQALLDLAKTELARCLPAFEKTTITHWSVIKEPFATPSPVRGGDALRPTHQTGVPGFYLAGDWTQTGLPATIESAVASGHACAGLILGS